jgi:hypothetical protein
MPISPRLSGRLYNGVKDLIDDANEFLFFGTFSLSMEQGILNRIIQRKQANPSLLVACLLPPPTDFILWDFAIRARLLRAYGLTRVDQVELARSIAENPQPAYAILENLWQQSRALPAQRGVVSHIRRIADLYSNSVITFLEPNMHAKFVASESNIYEGSGNLTQYGLKVNVEVYNFYPRRYGGVYAYASRSYRGFLSAYLANFPDWKTGARYLTHANELGTHIEQVAASIGIRFNPKVTRQKVDILNKAREDMATIRSDLWQLPGHKFLSKLDLVLSLIRSEIQSAFSRLWTTGEKEIEAELARSIEEKLQKIGYILSQTSQTLKQLGEKPEALTWYESEYLEKTVQEAKRFEIYLSEYAKKHSEEP